MISALLPKNETQRLNALLNYNILDTDAEPGFDEVAELASQICGTSLGIVSLVDRDRQWFKAVFGKLDTRETSRDIAFCAHAILQNDPFVVPDAWEDARFHDNPLVQSGVVRFYAGTPLENEEGLKIGTLCVIDTTPRKLSEMQLFALKVLAKQVMNQIELRAKNREMAGLIGELNKAVVAQKEAREETVRANQARSRFLAHMSHEVRTPLHGILGIAEILEDTQLSGDQRNLLSTLKSSGSALLGIVNNVLDFSQLDSGHISIEPIPFNLHEVCGSIVHSFSPQIEKKGLGLEFCIDAHMPRIVRGDALRLRQILTHLLSNAVKFTEKGWVRLAMTIADRSDEEMRIRFSISDTGPGISPEKRTHIYDAFQQAEPGVSALHRGSGLGVSIAKQLAEYMGGQIGIESPLYAHPTSVGGPGTEFWVEIPFVLSEQATGNTPGQTDAEPPVFPSGIRILVAEDNLVNQVLIRRFMSQLGMQICMVNNGKEALEMLNQERFHLFLTDINMPEMDGIVATRILRNTYQNPIPVIAMTANAFDSDEERYLAAGMNEVLRKPFNKAKLVACLQKHLLC